MDKLKNYLIFFTTKVEIYRYEYLLSPSNRLLYNLCNKQINHKDISKYNFYVVEAVSLVQIVRFSIRLSIRFRLQMEQNENV